jgi:hypothetical protein
MPVGDGRVRAVLPPELHDRNWLAERLDAGSTVRDIANETGTDPRRVQLR